MPVKKKWMEILETKIRNVYPYALKDDERDEFFQNAINSFVAQTLAKKPDVESDKWYWGDMNGRQLNAQPKGSGRESNEDILNRIKSSSKTPEKIAEYDDVIKRLVDMLDGMPNWAHPKSLTNVVSQPSTLSIIASMMSAIANPNLAEAEYSANFAAAEIEVVAMIAEILGYNKVDSGGLSTTGGSMNYFYATKSALCRCLGLQSRYNGIRQEVKILASKGGHYVKSTVADWSGLGMKNLIEVDVNPDNSMNIDHLEEELRNCYKNGISVAMITATAGTTDAFAIDNITEIIALTRKLSKEYYVDSIPFIYVDAVIGWPWLTFSEYDFKKNPLEFSTRALKVLADSVLKLSGIKYADAVGIDFHKTGFSPYNSSLIVYKDKKELEQLERISVGMSYLFNNKSSVYTPGKYTFECSRSATSGLIAWTHLHYFGLEGYQVMLGHLVELQQSIRDELEFYQHINVVNQDNNGLVTLFRVYPTNIDADIQFQNELNKERYSNDLDYYNNFQMEVYNILNDAHYEENPPPAIGLTTKFKLSEYGKPIVALKAYLMGAHSETDPEFIKKEIVDFILKAIDLATISMWEKGNIPNNFREI